MPPDHRNFVAGVAPVEQSAEVELAWRFVFRGGEVLIHADYASGSVIPRLSGPADLDLEPVRTSFIGQLGGEHVYAWRCRTTRPRRTHIRFAGCGRCTGWLTTISSPSLAAHRNSGVGTESPVLRPVRHAD